MTSFNKKSFPTLRNLASNTIHNNLCEIICQLIVLMLKQDVVEKLAGYLSFLVIVEEAVFQLHAKSLKDQKEKISLAPNKAPNGKQLLKGYGRYGFESEQSEMHVFVLQGKTGGLTIAFSLGPFTENGLEMGQILKLDTNNGYGMEALQKLDAKNGYEIEQFLKHHAENGYGIKPYSVMVTLEGLLHKVHFIDSESSVLKDCFQQSLLKKKEFSKENPIEKRLMSDDKKSISNPSYEKLSCAVKELAEISGDVPKHIKEQATSTAIEDVQTCEECRERIKTKKFFDERRFGILEKCGCVICYGCIRNLTGSSNGVVKGPVKCSRCFVKSENVASNSRWIQGEEKVEFFKQYCKNLQSTNIKMRLGWTSFPSRKDDMWTRVP